MYWLRTWLSEALLRFLTSSEYMEKVWNPRKLVALERTLTEIDELLKNNTEKKEKAIEQLKTKLENFWELDISIQAINKSIYSIYRHLKECENIERTFALRVTVKWKTQEDKQRYLESIWYNIVSLLRKPWNPNYIELVNSDKPLVVNYYNKEREDGYKAVHTYLEINWILVEVQIMWEEEAKNASYWDPIWQSEKLKEGLFKNIFSDNENEDLVEKYKNLTKLLELWELPISLHRILYKSSAVSKLIEAIKRLLEGIIKKSRENL
jgi:hypothetical protein